MLVNHLEVFWSVAGYVDAAFFAHPFDYRALGLGYLAREACRGSRFSSARLPSYCQITSPGLESQLTSFDEGLLS
jgi:hypothetical protein